MARRILTGKGKAVRLEGIPEVAANVNHLLSTVGGNKGRAIGLQVKHVLMTGALMVRDEARDMAPVKTGKLKSAIFASYGDEKKPDVIVGVNYKIAPHAHLQEYGSSQNAPHPFMRPAITATRPTVARVVAEGFRKIVDEALP